MLHYGYNRANRSITPSLNKLMFARLLCLVATVLCTACASPQRNVGADARTNVHQFRFEDGGIALYFTIEKSSVEKQAVETLVFVVPGSDCISMAPFLPQYFHGLGGGGAMRIFILHKRHIRLHDAGHNCAPAYIDDDYPSRTLADQAEFTSAQLHMAQEVGDMPKRILAIGISEGAELVPLLGHRFPQITHVALVSNGAMNPRDAFQMQAWRFGFSEEANTLIDKCKISPNSYAARRHCRYWNEVFSLEHYANIITLQQPIFVAMGEEDTSVPPESARIITPSAALSSNRLPRVVLIPGSNHALQQNKLSLLPYLWEALDQWMME